jgi:hypothetical protein
MLPQSTEEIPKAQFNAYNPSSRREQRNIYPRIPIGPTSSNQKPRGRKTGINDLPTTTNTTKEQISDTAASINDLLDPCSVRIFGSPNTIGTATERQQRLPK